ncbi:hypothetical protein GCM10010339_08280 [Streptomyces alanosinicus]|uniref:Uncharacterized protein n=1 Tax=Streptomyces alanosinicus TaxID=68171 RepID=A0A918YDI7_9ACTN|nr:hypothetical protein GCM10010339_08280 [Streptomyces alanosinicus]
MAALAAYGTGAAATLVDTAKGMVRAGGTVSPRPEHTARFAEPYARLIGELGTRGWLPSAVAAYSRARIGTT